MPRYIDNILHLIDILNGLAMVLHNLPNFSLLISLGVGLQRILQRLDSFSWNSVVIVDELFDLYVLSLIELIFLIL